jgi:hypothetical protein
MSVGEPWIVAQRETEFAARADGELDALSSANEASRLLAEVIPKVTIDATKTERDAGELRRHALWFMAIITFRALRAAMHMFAIGYEDQAIGFHRLIDEIHNRAVKVSNDESGDQARAWLEGKNFSKGAKLAGQDFWEFLSGPVHANVAAVRDWLAVTQPDGTTRVTVGPERRPDMANPALTYMSGEGRDIAGMLARHSGVRLDLRTLDAEIRAAQEVHIPKDAETQG